MSNLPSILPPGSSALEVLLEQFPMRLNGAVDPLSTLWDPMTCPVAFLPWLAWSLSVDEWDSDWSVATKRAALAESLAIHRLKGTPAAVKRALGAAGYGDASVVEFWGWADYDGSLSYDGSEDYKGPDDWAEYRIYLVRPITIEQSKQVRTILSTVAPARCHLKGLYFTEALNAYNARISYDGQFTHGVA
jgi:phage tail P2-like protein